MLAAAAAAGPVLVQAHLLAVMCHLSRSVWHEPGVFCETEFETVGGWEQNMLNRGAQVWWSTAAGSLGRGFECVYVVYSADQTALGLWVGFSNGIVKFHVFCPTPVAASLWFTATTCLPKGHFARHVAATATHKPHGPVFYGFLFTVDALIAASRQESRLCTMQCMCNDSPEVCAAEPSAQFAYLFH